MWKLTDNPKCEDKESTCVRAVTMPVAGPEACLVYDKKQRQWVDAELPAVKGVNDQELLWYHFRDHTKKAWGLVSRASNWAIRELFKHEPKGDPQSTKLPKYEPLNLFALYQKNPDRAEWEGMAKSLSTVLRLAEAKYRSDRFQALQLHAKSLPSFGSPLPLPIHNQDWFPCQDTEADPDCGDWFVAIPLGPYRWIIRLRRDRTSVKFEGIWKQILSGELTRCEAQIYGRTVQPNDNRNASDSAQAKSVEIASKGIHSSAQAKSFLSALIGDVMTETIGTRQASSACNAMGKLIKIADMELKLAAQGHERSFNLVDGNGEDALAERERQLRAELAAIENARKS